MGPRSFQCTTVSYSRRRQVAAPQAGGTGVDVVVQPGVSATRFDNARSRWQITYGCTKTSHSWLEETA